MMDFECAIVRFGFGDCAETLCERITADGERHVLREEMPYFGRCEPVGLRRLPVRQIEIGILFSDGWRRAGRLLVLQVTHDGQTLFLGHSEPQAFACTIAVGKLSKGSITMPEINKRCFHNFEFQSVPSIGTADRPPALPVDYDYNK